MPLESEEQAEATKPEQETETPKPARDKHALIDLYGNPLPPGAVARMGTMRWRHIGTVISVVYSPGGKLIATSEINEGPDGEKFASTGMNWVQRALDGKTMVPKNPPDKSIHLWHIDTGPAPLP